MNDFLNDFERYKDVKEILDLINEVRQLRWFYGNKLFEEMLRHINKLTEKYSQETALWNSVNNQMPMTYQEHYENAELFLKAKGEQIILMKVIQK